MNLDRLEAALADLATAIRGADFPGAEIAAAAAEEALAEPGPLPARARLAGLRRRARDTAALVDAARRGLLAGRLRAAEIAAASGGVATYGRDGARATLTTAAPAALRRT